MNRFFMKTTALVVLSILLFISIHVIVGLIFGAKYAAMMFGCICFLAFCVCAFVPVIKDEAELGDLLK
jgi:hypothetical protein